MKKNKKRFLSILTLGALTSSLIFSVGCDEEKTINVALIFKSQSQYWENPKLGATHASEELNAEVYFDAPEKEDINAQISMVKDAVSNKVDAIVISPVEDDDELAQLLQSAQNNGIKVITIDSDSREETRSVCISTNNEYAGAIAARKAYELLDGQGNIGIVTHTPTASNAIERKSGFTSQIDSYNKDSEEEIIKVSVTENGNNSIAEAKEAAIKLIKENPDVEVIFATNQTMTIGTCMAVDELGKEDSVDVLGFDSFQSKEGSKSSDEYIKSGTLDGFILQNPYNMGYLGVKYARDLIQGQAIASNIDTGATLVTSDNINDSDVQLIMNPMEN